MGWMRNLGLWFLRSRARVIVGLPCLLFLLGCGGGHPDPFSEESEIHLVRIEPRADRVFLNQKLVFVFDQPLDPQSVTERTLRIQASDGSFVRGERLVRGNIVEFIPIPPLAPDLKDGSFQPGETYSVIFAHYPRPLAIQGLRGELLVKAPRRTWTAVDLKNLPEGYPSPLLPNSPSGPFVLLPPPKFVLNEGEPAIRLRFNHSLYPPSVRPGAFRILSKSGLVQSIPIANTRILPRVGPGGFGSIAEISPAWDLEPGLYRLFLLPGIRGVQDDRLQPLKIWEIQTGTGLPKLRDLSREGAWVEFLVDKKVPPRIFHSFQNPRQGIGEMSELKGTGWDPEGALQWGPKGLFSPDLEFARFQSMGDLCVKKGMVLKAGIRVPGTDYILPGDGKPWDFDRIRVLAGATLVLHLDKRGPTILRVAGRVDLAGKIRIQMPPGFISSPAPSSGVLVGDPRPSWPRRGGQLRWLVGGWVRALDPFALEAVGPTQKGYVGFLWARGPIEGSDALHSRLQVWQKPISATPPPANLSPFQLKGSWAAISPWFPVPLALGASNLKNPLKGILVGIPMERMDLEYLLQVRKGGGESQKWQPPGGLTGLGDASFIRVAVLWSGGVATAQPLMSSFGIR